MQKNLISVLLTFLFSLTAGRPYPLPARNEGVAVNMQGGALNGGSSRILAEVATRLTTTAAVAKPSVEFEPNRGQTGNAVEFIARSGRGTTYFTHEEVVLSRRIAPHTSRTMRVSFVRPNPNAKLSGSDEGGGKVNYFIGNNPQAWR